MNFAQCWSVRKGMWFMFCPSRPMVFKKSVTPALAIMVLKMPASEKKLRTSSRVTNCGTAMVMMNNVRQSFWHLVFLLLMSMARNTPPKKLVKVAKNAHTNVQPSTRPKA